MAGQHKGKIYYSMQAISILPIILFGILILFFDTYYLTKSMSDEVAANLDTSAHLCISLIDLTYPGDYELKENTINGQTAYSLYKGSVNITSAHDLLDRIKEDTGMDVSLFYQDTRILTTIYDWEQKRIIGSGAPDNVINDVLKQNQATFYDNVIINGTEYFAYYHPITNSDGTVVGMLFVGKPSADINELIRSSSTPIIVVGLVSMVIASIISFSYAKYFLASLHKLKTFFRKVSTGNLHAKMDPSLLQHGDEFSEIAGSAVSMQNALRNMVELDSLTELFNRRTGEQKLLNTYHTAQDTKVPYSVVMADIDYFKSINDTYGHHSGDIVLQNIANLLKAHTLRKGYAVRWGGEEFLLVFDKSNLEETLSYLDVLQKEIREYQHTLEENQVSVTMTFGVVCNPTLNINDLIESADEKLYDGKTNGRDCIIS